MPSSSSDIIRAAISRVRRLHVHRRTRSTARWLNWNRLLSALLASYLAPAPRTSSDHVPVDDLTPTVAQLRAHIVLTPAPPARPLATAGATG